MAYTTVDKSTDHFNANAYSGNSSTQTITGIGHFPDFSWIKQRDGLAYHQLTDVLRGVNSQLSSNDPGAAAASATCITAFNSDGFALGSNGDVNGTGLTYSSWNWKGNGAGVANAVGSISSTVSANTTSGFSIVTYTGTNTLGATVGHGLGVVPKMIIVKSSTGAGENWNTYHTSLGATKFMNINTNTSAFTDINAWNNTSPTASVFTIGGNSGDTGRSGSTYVAYCFSDVRGFSKINGYVGNGSIDGTFLYTGFRPSLVLIKNTDAAESWFVYDKARGYAGNRAALFPDDTAADAFSDNISFLSNGFKLRTTGAILNGAGTNYLYMAIAAAPLVGTNDVPATAV
jgi:hypothetical protein